MKKYPKINPKFIKDKHGKTKQIFLDMQSYESLVSRINDFEQILKKQKQKKK